MANKISRKKIDKLWVAWQEWENENKVATLCHVSRRTVTRYRDIEQWDMRLGVIRRVAQEKSDYRAAEARAESIKLVRHVKGEYAKALSRVKQSGLPLFDLSSNHPASTTAALNEIVKLEQLLMGAPTERIDSPPPHMTININ